MTINDLQKEAHAIAKEKGWHDTPRSVGDLIALCHSELSEALEAYRDTGIRPLPIDTTLQDKPEGFAVELADCIIRIADMAEMFNIDLETFIGWKMAYNRTRSYRHGGKNL